LTGLGLCAGGVGKMGWNGDGLSFCSDMKCECGKFLHTCSARVIHSGSSG
jgi:hypothetical protein